MISEITVCLWVRTFWCLFNENSPKEYMNKDYLPRGRMVKDSIPLKRPYLPITLVKTLTVFVVMPSDLAYAVTRRSSNM